MEIPLQLIVFTVITSSVKSERYKKFKSDLQENIENLVKNVPLQVILPKKSTKKIKTSDLIRHNFKSIRNKINRGVINDNCPAGINCIGESMTDALDSILSLLSTRLGKIDIIGYKSARKNDIMHQKFILKRDHNMFELEDEEDKKSSSDDEQFNEKNIDKFKVLHRMFKPEDKGERDKQGRSIKKLNNRETTKYDHGNMTEVEIQNLYSAKAFTATTESDYESDSESDSESEESDEEGGPTMNGVNYYYDYNNYY